MASERPSAADRRLSVGVLVSQQKAPSYAALRDVAARAEELGADVVFNTDHFFPWSGDPAGAHFECWTMLAAWAEQTERVQLGALVTGAGYRNPDLLADMARTVDHISAKPSGSGRLILGLGAGWLERDYAEYGYEFGSAGSRIGLLAESLLRIKARLGKLNPPPAGPLPILVGGGGERKTLRVVAEHADIWHSFSALPELRRKSAVLAEHCAATGRDPADIVRAASWSGPQLTDDLVAAGASLIVCDTSAPDYSLEPLRAALAWRDQWR
ncbi:MAG: LLM class F420-dependent oxidoreductase [Segniliparus sp.]|uniref:LLM class F420-dependent oxidoreductase n=1 Tax=Segniliparus sp. TaxID=2804064 RepID=UPI003F3D5EB0